MWRRVVGGGRGHGEDLRWEPGGLAKSKEANVARARQRRRAGQGELGQPLYQYTTPGRGSKTAEIDRSQFWRLEV